VNFGSGRWFPTRSRLAAQIYAQPIGCASFFKNIFEIRFIFRQMSPLFSSRIPLYYYITLGGVVGFFGFFAVLFFIDRLTLGQAAFCFVLFAGCACARFGRYPARIILYAGKIEVRYLFPWNRPVDFCYHRITQMDHKDRPSSMLFKGDSWYQNYKWLSLCNENGEVCAIRYTINDGDDRRLLEHLRSLADKS